MMKYTLFNTETEDWVRLCGQKTRNKSFFTYDVNNIYEFCGIASVVDKKSLKHVIVVSIKKGNPNFSDSVSLIEFCRQTL